MEAGSAGEVLLRERKYHYTTCATQTAALQSVLDKKADATVIDIIMAACNTGEGQQYDELGIVVSLNDKKICVGCRKDSDLTQEVNAFIQAAYEDRSINALAESMGLRMRFWNSLLKWRLNSKVTNNILIANFNFFSVKYCIYN